MIAFHLSRTKPRSKVLILDPGDSLAEREQYEQAWPALYPGMIEWVPDSHVVRVDQRQPSVTTRSVERHKANVLNLIPPQRAGRLASQSGLADTTGWCPVDAASFESTLQESIFVIGNACIAGDMPKAGSSANSQAKSCAANIAARIAGIEAPQGVR